MIDRKEHEQKTVDTEQLIVDLTPKLVEMAGILDKKSAARMIRKSAPVQGYYRVGDC